MGRLFDRINGWVGDFLAWPPGHPWACLVVAVCIPVLAGVVIKVITWLFMVGWRAF